MHLLLYIKNLDCTIKPICNDTSMYIIRFPRRYSKEPTGVYLSKSKKQSHIFKLKGVCLSFLFQLLSPLYFVGVATALSAIAASTSCGIFTLGMVCWWVGPKGAISGAIAGALVAGTISLGSQAAAAKGLRWPPVDFSTACPHNLTMRISHEVVSTF